MYQSNWTLPSEYHHEELFSFNFLYRKNNVKKPHKKQNNKTSNLDQGLRTATIFQLLFLLLFGTTESKLWNYDTSDIPAWRSKISI